MILVVTRSNGDEETYDVPPSTRLRTALRDDVWFFRTLSGGEVAMSSGDVLDLKLGNVEISVVAADMP